MIAKVRDWMGRDSIYTQTYDEQQIKSANESTGDRTVRGMRALYTTDHCDAECKKYWLQDTMPKRQGNQCWYACVFMHVDGEGKSIDTM